MGLFVDVAVAVGVRKTFAYAVPARLREQVARGVRVIVPFGRKVLTGFVVAVRSEPPSGGFTVRPIREVLDLRPLVPEGVLDAALWAAAHYVAPPGEALRAALPAGLLAAGEEEIRLAARTADLLAGGLRPTGLGAREQRVLEALRESGPGTRKQLAAATGIAELGPVIAHLAAGGWIETAEAVVRARVRVKEQIGVRALPADAREVERLPERQRDLYRRLDLGEAVPLRQALRQAGVTAAVADALARKGLVELAPMSIERRPLDLQDRVDRKPVRLTAAQQRVFDEVRAALDGTAPRRYLLHGVTGSGKTEVYLRLIGEVLERRESALLLVPEIGLTPLLSRIALSHFPDRVGLLHSGLAAGERHDQWLRIRAGHAPVVVGTRSAVFAPLDNLRLVVLDEEQDASYKQDESPCYHAREVAWRRVLASRGVLLMGSATPSIETYHGARESGEIGYLSLPERIEARPLAAVEVVDMSLEFQRHGRSVVLSQALETELAGTLGRGEQAILLLNRRGYSRSLLCRSCGHVFECPDCSVAMTFHRHSETLVCHYCGQERAVPAACTNCAGQYIYFTGVGTEQLEEILRRRFPRCRVARVDRDTTSRRGTLRRILLEFSRGELDLLVGTQILAKGHDFPNVTLVGVIGADAGLGFPDFRAAERTFQLLTQVAGRAGRGELPGKVVIQSFYPDHYALRHARRQDYAGFFAEEREYRRLMGYPPFTRLIQIVVPNASQEAGLAIGGKIAAALRASAEQRGLAGELRVLGPAVAPLEKLRGSYRCQLLVKASLGVDPSPVLNAALESLAARKVALRDVRIDADPLSLL